MTHPLSREFCRPMAGQKFIVDGRRYLLGGSLGDSAAGLGRKARDENDREYAVKFFAPDPKYIEESAFDHVAARSKREGERGVHLVHPHLLKIYSYCENEDGNAFESDDPKNPFLLMEQIKGKTLESFIKKLPQKGIRHNKTTLEYCDSTCQCNLGHPQKQTYPSRHKTGEYLLTCQNSKSGQSRN